jgi:N-acetylneuraminic acid mutarotase
MSVRCARVLRGTALAAVLVLIAMAVPGLAAAPVRGAVAAAAAVAVAAAVGARPQPAPASSPATSPWTAAADYPEDVWGNAAATDPATGRLYSVGGAGAYDNVIARGYAYDPATGTWTQLPDMSYPRDAPVAAVIGGRLYVTGGCVTSGVCTSADVQVYDPATNTWAAASAYPRKVSFLGCGAISGKLYCAGGFDHDLGLGTSAAYVYDPQASAWSPIADLPVGLWGGRYTAASGQLLISGGMTRFGSKLTNQGFAYDPGTSTWAPLPSTSDLTYRGGSACGFYKIGSLDSYGDVFATVQQLPGDSERDGGAPVQAVGVTLTATPSRT